MGSFHAKWHLLEAAGRNMLISPRFFIFLIHTKGRKFFWPVSGAGKFEASCQAVFLS